MRLQDAEALLAAKRFSGAMYLGGYAVECALLSLHCYKETKDQFEDTALGGTIERLTHNLHALLHGAVRTMILGTELHTPFCTVARVWKYNLLRYSVRDADPAEAKQFLSQVRVLHSFLLKQQGEGPSQ